MHFGLYQVDLLDECAIRSLTFSVSVCFNLMKMSAVVLLITAFDIISFFFPFWFTSNYGLLFSDIMQIT